MLHSDGEALQVVPSAKDIWLEGPRRKVFSAVTTPNFGTSSPKRTGKDVAFWVGLPLSYDTAALGWAVTLLLLIYYCIDIGNCLEAAVLAAKGQGKNK